MYAKLMQSMTKDSSARIEPHLSRLSDETLLDQTSSKPIDQMPQKPISEAQFTEALERCLQRSVYEEYNYLPRWAFYSALLFG